MQKSPRCDISEISDISFHRLPVGNVIYIIIINSAHLCYILLSYILCNLIILKN